LGLRGTMNNFDERQPLRLLLTSKSPLKLKAVKEIPEFEKCAITSVKTSCVDLHSQSFGKESILACAKKRIQYVFDENPSLSPEEFVYIVSIENGIVPIQDGVEGNFQENFQENFQDRYFAVIRRNDKQTVMGQSFGVMVPASARARTAGKIISEKNPEIDIDRVDQIVGALTNAMCLFGYDQ
jgi:non-canonical (house-cleaning) NTP pyrophosphatase